MGRGRTWHAPRIQRRPLNLPTSRAPRTVLPTAAADASRKALGLRVSVTHVSGLDRLKMVGPNGLEPSTSSVSGKRSNQLSYGPIAYGVTSQTQTIRPPKF